MLKFLLVTLLISFTVATVAANGLYVDNIKGNDKNDGSKSKPLKSLRKAAASLRPGMTLFLTPNKKPYKTPLILFKLPSEKGKFITIDGQNSVLNGLFDTRDKWSKVSEGLYKRIVKRGFQARRNFMVIDGKLQRMGIDAKLRRPKLPTADKLRAGEWTFDKKSKTLFLKLDKNKKISDIALLEPFDPSLSGVMIKNSNNLIIKNLTVEYFKNDGFNIHGDCKNIRFENITAKYSGDDGISAHGNCEIKVKNFLSIGNVSAICHVSNAVSENDNILIIDSYGTDIYLLNRSNSFNNLVVRSSGFVKFTKGSLTVTNALFTNPAKDKRAIFSILTKQADFKNVMIENRRVIENNSTAKYFTKPTKDFNSSFVAEVDRLLKR